MKTITVFSVLMSLAREEGICEQRLDRDPFQSEANKKAYEDAKIAHENYRQLCLKADEEKRYNIMREKTEEFLKWLWNESPIS